MVLNMIAFAYCKRTYFSLNVKLVHPLNVKQTQVRCVRGNYCCYHNHSVKSQNKVQLLIFIISSCMLL